MFNQLKDILLQSKKKFFSNTQGEHLSLFNGNGLEFNEIREYNIDDDIRHINWKITARTKKPSVNIFYENKQINISLIYLNSGGLFYFENSKKNLALTLFSSLSYLSLNCKDSLNTLFFDENMLSFSKNCKNKSQIYLNYDFAIQTNPLNKTINYEELQEFILKNIKTKSIIFFIGDFLQMPNFNQLVKNYEIYTLIIRDKKEENLELLGQYNIIDTNNLKTSTLNITKNSVKKYNEYMKSYDLDLINYFKHNNINYKKFYTIENPYDNLRDFLKGKA